MTESDRLDDAAIGQRLARLDELLERVEQVPGPTVEAAIEAVQTLTEVYGEALARVLSLAGQSLAEELADDELLGHLLVLHDLHPDPVERRVSRAIEGLRPAVQERGGDVEPAGIDGGVADVRLSIKGCSSSGVEDAVREAVLAVAPELSGVKFVPAADDRDDAFIPLDALLQRPASAGGSA
ncbi:Fe-S cluster biogenesis protein NfuA [Halopolyspora algeriensis]|uniref:Fe-S cluster biogenesis protein NfuA n=1 Tax=Halopolyspora algeriensis TaxID=1500506 RepID=A0A368VYI9_9ACTN|nr:NifU family protein [Halopolyspora algeriensis]RCW44644.1 Fe-S cluster biogenesis protein NfuA [Halopolyspora algeriensis]TQM56005.1 Fe-S cluster biogenesis protein NfuA [Halopolyspora algeriensis]